MANLRSLDQLMSLEGKRALVTGAAAGIGKAIAYRLAEAGAELEVVDIDGENLATAKSEWEAVGMGVRLHLVDLSHKEAIDRLWECLDGDGPDILVNNAGTYPLKSFVEVDEAFYRRVMATNLDAVYWMCQRCKCVVAWRGRRPCSRVRLRVPMWSLPCVKQGGSAEAVLCSRSCAIPE
jgi:NAD(P)-dependent dehydrogenase (short-subunit alcohol dehydrogenase family)